MELQMFWILLHYNDFHLNHTKNIKVAHLANNKIDVELKGKLIKYKRWLIALFFKSSFFMWIKSEHLWNCTILSMKTLWTIKSFQIQDFFLKNKC